MLLDETVIYWRNNVVSNSAQAESAKVLYNSRLNSPVHVKISKIDNEMLKIQVKFSSFHDATKSIGAFFPSRSTCRNPSSISKVDQENGNQDAEHRGRDKSSYELLRE